MNELEVHCTVYRNIIVMPTTHVGFIVSELEQELVSLLYSKTSTNFSIFKAFVIIIHYSDSLLLFDQDVTEQDPLAFLL